MDRSLKSGAWIAATLVLFAVVFVALVSLAGGSAGGTLSSGRTVMVFSDTLYLCSESSKESATITANFRKIVVHPTSLIVDGRKVGDLDEAVRAVEVRVKFGSITFLADGQDVPTTLE